MWLYEADGFAEFFKGYIPYYLLVALPIFIIMSPVNPVEASHEFTAFRMQQYDLHNVPHGCRSASFNLEGRTHKHWSTSRHCVFAHINDLTVDDVNEIRKKAGAFVLVWPNGLKPKDDKLETELMQEWSIPVYMVKETEETMDILRDMESTTYNDDKTGTALNAMINTISSNGYQFVVSAPTPQKLDSKPVTLHSKLVGRSGTAQTIVIAAHYDSSHIFPQYHQGYSTASGVAAVMELARVFSLLYSKPETRGAPTILFVLTSAGQSLNYFSAKKWLEEQLDSSDAPFLQDVSFVMCLDSIGTSEELKMHVSKPPKNGSSAHSLQSRLHVPVVHKKINLADEVLAWQHERFSIRRMTAFTISALESHKDRLRSSLVNDEAAESKNTFSNTARIAIALASHIYNMTDIDSDEKSDYRFYEMALGVSNGHIQDWFSYLTKQPISSQVVTTTPVNGGLTGVLERGLSRYVDVTVSVHTVDKREPEYSLYTPIMATLYVYKVKPAVFDLVLTIAIVAYLSVIYFVLQMFPVLYNEYIVHFSGKLKKQH